MVKSKIFGILAGIILANNSYAFNSKNLKILEYKIANKTPIHGVRYNNISFPYKGIQASFNLGKNEHCLVKLYDSNPIKIGYETLRIECDILEKRFEFEDSGTLDLAVYNNSTGGTYLFNIIEKVGLDEEDLARKDYLFITKRLMKRFNVPVYLRKP